MRAKLTFTKRNFFVNSSPRIEKMNGRSYYVLPMTILKEGILAGSQGPIFYPEKENKKSPQIWNGMPLVVYHPMVGNRYVSARNPEILNKYGIGFNFNTQHDDNTKKVVSEGWFDIKRVQRFDSVMLKENPTWDPILPRIKTGDKIELSTGLFANNIPSEGQTYKGRGYKYVAKDYRPDHIAILPDQTGACSVQDGCGVNNTKHKYDEYYTYAKSLPSITANKRISKLLPQLKQKKDNKKFATLLGLLTNSTIIYKTTLDNTAHLIDSELYQTVRDFIKSSKGGKFTFNTNSTLEDINSVFVRLAIVNKDEEPHLNRLLQAYSSIIPKRKNGMTREQTVNFITTNCDCWKNPSDKAVLNKMSPEGLKNLKKSIEERMKKDKKFDAIANKFEEITDNKLEELEADDAFDVLANAMKETNEEKKNDKKGAADSSSDNLKDKKKTPVTNKKKSTPVVNEDTEEDEEVVSNKGEMVQISKEDYKTFIQITNSFKKEQEAKKMKLIQTLIGNTTGISKKVITEKVTKYSKYDIPTLEEMVELKANSEKESYFPNGGDETDFIKRATNFIGAAGAGITGNNVATDEEPLVAPTVNWAEK